MSPFRVKQRRPPPLRAAAYTFLVPRISEDAHRAWFNLAQWDSKVYSERLPNIRNGKGCEVRVLPCTPYPEFMICDANKPVRYGTWVSDQVKITSDPRELRAMLQDVDGGDALGSLIDDLVRQNDECRESIGREVRKETRESSLGSRASRTFGWATRIFERARRSKNTMFKVHPEKT